MYIDIFAHGIEIFNTYFEYKMVIKLPLPSHNDNDNMIETPVLLNSGPLPYTYVDRRI
jgi:hypothetical protein